jgi:hypothetical protein
VADAGGDSCVDQRDLVDHLMQRRAVRDEKSIDTVKSALEGGRFFEVDRRNRDSGW